MSSTNVIDYITIASTGNATDFGNLSAASKLCSGSASSTRGIINLGYVSDYTDTIEYVTIGSTGNTTDFGNMTIVMAQGSSASSATRALFVGGANFWGF